MRHVTTLHLARLLEAHEYFEEKGFKYVDVPWCVSREAILLTRPPQVTGEPHSFEAGGIQQYPVASAEQSFLQLRMDAKKLAAPTNGDYCAITPCFRNESKLDDLHQSYFMKLELISWVPEDGKFVEQEIALHRMISTVQKFFDQEGLETEVIRNEELANGDPLCVEKNAFDIVSLHGTVEVGSYGIRQHPEVGRWIYGTGLAEPRFSYALGVEIALEKAAGQPA